MQITETSAEGLKHEFKVVVDHDDIEQRVKDRLTEIGRAVRLPGFRPGKVPLQVLRRRYGPSVRGEVLERTVSDGSNEAIRGHNLRPALQPRVEIVSFNEGTDLEYKLAVEVLPEIQPMNFAELEIERLRPEIDDSEIDEALQRLAERQRKAEPVDRPAESGDQLVVDFEGKIDGAVFPGGSAKDYSLTLGSGSFVPGFEDQLIGAAKDETRTVTVTFPADFGGAELAGREAVFTVLVKEVRAFQPQAVDDSLAQTVGMENLAQLRDSVRERIERDYAGMSRQRVKRTLLDALAERHDFPVPEGMVEIEFDTIWKQYEAERQRSKEAGEAEAAESAEAIRADYRAIAVRRVRLGLLLSEVGARNHITVAQDELNRKLVEEARRFPGQERRIMEFYRDHPEAQANLKAPIFEEKVIDFILELANVTERRVPVREFLAAEAADEALEAGKPGGEGEATGDKDAPAGA